MLLAAWWLGQAQEMPEPQQLVWPVVAAGVLAVLGILTWVVRAVRHARARWRALRVRIERWAQDQARMVHQTEVAATRAAEQTATSNGHSAGQLVEQLAGEIGVLTQWVGEGQDLARRAADRADRAAEGVVRVEERLAAHERTPHGTEGGS